MRDSTKRDTRSQSNTWILVDGNELDFDAGRNEETEGLQLVGLHKTWMDGWTAK